MYLTLYSISNTDPIGETNPPGPSHRCTCRQEGASLRVNVLNVRGAWLFGSARTCDMFLWKSTFFTGFPVKDVKAIDVFKISCPWKTSCSICWRPAASAGQIRFSSPRIWKNKSSQAVLSNALVQTLALVALWWATRFSVLFHVYQRLPGKR